MRKLTLFILLSLSTPLLAETDEESLYLRRIYTLWEDKDYLFAKRQIEEFCHKYPNSPLIERFTMMLGDIAFHEKEYEVALQHYAKIQDPQIKQTLNAKKWHALYQLKRYGEIQVEISPELLKKSDEAKFYYAESLFREGCSPTLEKKDAKKLWLDALGFYGELLTSPVFMENAMIATAEIYRFLGDPKQAAKYYLELADIFKNRDGIKQEEVLYHASVALKEYDEDKAISIASHLARFGVKRRKEGAHLWFLLLVKTKRFEDLKANQELFLTSLTEEKKGLYFYFLGKHYTSVPDLEKCALYPLPKPYLHEAITTVIELARKSNDLPCLERNVELFKVKFPDHVGEIEKIDLILAQSYHEAKKLSQALFLLDQVISRDSKNWMAYLAKAKILLEERKIEEAHNISRMLMQLYPDKKEVVRFSVNLKLDRLGEGSDMELLEEIEKSLEIPDIFSKEEKQNLHLYLAKGHIALKNFSKAIQLLNTLAETNFAPSETYFLLSYAHLAEKKDLKTGIEYGEKALLLDDYSFERRKLHLHLFNAYLELAKEAPIDFNEHAAEHLFAIANEMPISLENRLWLANYFVRKCALCANECDAKKAIGILEPLFLGNEDYIRFESQALILSDLYEMTAENEKNKTLIEKLLSLQSTLSFERLSEIQLKMANLIASSDPKLGVKAYLALENDPNPFVALSAKLKESRLFFAHLSKDLFNEDNPDVQHHLRQLKEIKMRKNLKFEPIHLESALDYAEVVSQLQKPGMRKKVLLQQLCQAKEEFLLTDDITSKDYHLSLNEMPEKAHLFAAYMRYFDARIYQLQSHFCKEVGDLGESNTKERAAIALFSSLRQGKYAVTQYIKEKSKVAMK